MDELYYFLLFQHIGSSSEVIASFQQTLWTVVPMSSGAIRVKSMGNVIVKDSLISSYFSLFFFEEQNFSTCDHDSVCISVVVVNICIQNLSCGHEHSQCFYCSAPFQKNWWWLTHFLQCYNLLVSDWLWNNSLIINWISLGCLSCFRLCVWRRCIKTVSWTHGWMSHHSRGRQWQRI